MATEDGQTASAVSLSEPVLDRAAIILAAAQARDVYATGAPYPKALQEMVGRRFSIVAPFGCGGPASDAQIGYVYDNVKQALRLSAKPEQWGDQDWAKALVGSNKTEAIEGFWLRRPWLSSSICPVGPETQIDPPSPEVLGLARVFEKDGSRLLRRGDRPYEITRRVPPAEIDAAAGYRIIYEGRIVAGEDEQPIRCGSESVDIRPICLVRVEFDRIAIETAGHDLLGEWSS